MDDNTENIEELTDNKENEIQPEQKAQKEDTAEPVLEEADEEELEAEDVPEKIKVKPKQKELKKIPLFAAIIAVLAAAVLATQITFLAVRQSYHSKLATISNSPSTSDGKFGDEKLAEIDELYRKYYIGEIDEDELRYGLIQGYLYGVGEKYGSYMSKEEYDEYLSTLYSSLVGIGIMANWNYDNLCIEVLDVYENAPAEEAGLQIGDFITEVDHQSVAELGYDLAVSKVRGESGTKVIITVNREGADQPIDFEITRRAFEAKTVRVKTYDNVAVLSISSFYASTLSELKTAVKDIQSKGCDRIVFDLRNNTGGLLTSIQSVLDYILPEGPTVRMVDAKGNETKLTSDASCLQMPMVVLVNGYTASAAELFTAALRDYEYATIVGTTTFGKGTVISPHELSDGSVMYISTELYYPPYSDNFEGKGITPDVVVELDEEAKSTSLYKLTYEKDNQLQKAVEIIKEK